MFANRSCEMSFWRDTELLSESDFDVVSAVPARAEGSKAAVNFTALLSYWRTHGSLLNPLLKTVNGGVINLKRECTSSHPQVAALSEAMLRLQDSVLQQFRLYYLSSGRFSSYQEEPVKCIEPWVLQEEGRDRKADPVPGAGPSSALQKNKVLLKRRSSVAITGSYSTLEAGEALKESWGLQEQIGHFKRKKPLSFPQISPVLESLLDHVRQKIIRAKWSKDLHEFSSDQMLSVSEFAAIRKDLDYRRAELSSKYIKYLACAAERPCWAIMGPEFPRVLGEDIGAGLLSTSLATAGVVDVQIHTLYICYDYDKELLSIKAICSPTDITDGLHSAEDCESDSTLGDDDSS